MCSEGAPDFNAYAYVYGGGDRVNQVDPTGTSSRLQRFLWCVATNLSADGAGACVDSCQQCAVSILNGNNPLFDQNCASCGVCLFRNGLSFSYLRGLVAFCWRWSKHGHIGSSSCLAA